MTIYKSFRARKSISSNSISVNFKYIADFIEDIDAIEVIDISFDGRLDVPIGIYQLGWNHKKMKGGTSELLKFAEILSVSYSPYQSIVLNGVYVSVLILRRIALKYKNLSRI